MGLLKGIDALCERVEEVLISCGIMVMAAVAIANVVSRNLFNSSFSWVEEVTQFSVVLVTFVGTSYAARKGVHIRMSILSDLMKGKTRKFLALLVSLGTAAFMFYLAW